MCPREQDPPVSWELDYARGVLEALAASLQQGI
jgi:hypothetical protein